MTSELGKASQARRRLEKVCERLARPSIQRLDSSAADVQAAVECLEQLEGRLLAGDRPAGWPQLVAEVRSIEREVQRAQALLEAAGQFYAGWAKLAGAGGDTGVANYTSSGKPGGLCPINRGELVLHG
ncbi:MAG: hypothetical protein LAP38_10210 [Acidobacteriia bacterium]|nr:hypothetical protein [Terriglobia bacterium]